MLPIKYLRYLRQIHLLTPLYPTEDYLTLQLPQHQLVSQVRNFLRGRMRIVDTAPTVIKPEFETDTIMYRPEILVVFSSKIKIPYHLMQCRHQ